MNSSGTFSQPIDAPAQHAGRGDVRARLETLQGRLAELGSDSALQQLVGGVSQAVERLTIEHAGMAEELLCLYEQLGVLFEVTRNLSTVESEKDVLALFIASLRRSFAGRFVVVERFSGEGAIEAKSVSAACDPWLVALVRRCVGQSKVIVDSPPGEGRTDAMVEAMVGPVTAGDSFVCAIVLIRSEKGEPFRASDMLLLESLSLFCGDLIRIHRLLCDLRLMSVATVRALVNAVDQKDRYTSGHSLRVAYFAMILGRALELNVADLQMLQWSALLHDVGKIGIRDDVLKKPGRLTDEEFEHIKEHPVRSYDVVKEIPQLRDALDGVRSHHEHYSGTGYPDGLIGEQIPLQARIIQVADIFDALTSTRSYRSAFEWPHALEVIQKDAGKITDPQLSELFVRLIHDRLASGPESWDELLARANRYGQTADGFVDLLEE